MCGEWRTADRGIGGGGGSSANANGGVILIGVDRQDLDRTERTVVEICRDNIAPMVHIVTEKLRIDDKNLLKIDVPPSLFVHKSSGRYFVRVASSKAALSEA